VTVSGGRDEHEFRQKNQRKTRPTEKASDKSGFHFFRMVTIFKPNFRGKPCIGQGVSEHGCTMRLYHLMSKLFPGSFRAKIACLAFLGVHVPLLAVVAYLMALGGFAGRQDLVVVVLVATLLGTVLTIAAMGVLLAPLRQIEATMAAVVDRRHAVCLPECYGDELGSLMCNLNSMIRGLERRIEIATASADLDPLTGVLNRRGFERLVPDPASGALLFLDLDRFKALNDTHGHAAGDAALCGFARIAMRSVREGDVFARLGGEEFALHLPDTGHAAALRLAERIRADVAASLAVGGQAVTVSIGVAHAGPATVARSSLMKAADAAMYAAKSGGRNQVASAADRSIASDVAA
jgi:diguanylate cyclase (GGDEF)-like protein